MSVFLTCKLQKYYRDILHLSNLRHILTFAEGWMNANILIVQIGLLDVKPAIDQTSKQVFLRRFPLSRFLAKTQRVIKIEMKCFSKNLSFGVDVKL